MLNLVIDVNAMDELMYDTLTKYFKTLSLTGYKSYDVVYKILVIDFIYEIIHSELRHYITNKDIKLMQDLLYQFLGSTCEISFPTNNRPCCVCICCNEGDTTTSSTTTSTKPPLITTTTTSTSPPNIATITFIHNVNTSYTVTYNNTVNIDVPSTYDKTVNITLPTESDSIALTINSITCNNNDYQCNKINKGNLPCPIIIKKGENIIITPIIEFIGNTSTTTTSSTTTSSLPPVINTIYHGVLKDFMSGAEFKDIPISTIMNWEQTNSKSITGNEINEFSISEDGYITYIIVPTEKVSFIYSALTSGGITSVFYDSTKENIEGETNNGFCFSKYTRGGVNANPGGLYNGINYDIYFSYNYSGENPEPLNIQMKNKTVWQQR